MSAMPLLNNPFLLFATISLTIQAIVLFLLLYGNWLRRRTKFVQHARVMTAALVLHLTMIATFMVPALLLALIPVFIIPHLTDATSILTLIHVPLGTVAVLLGVWLVLSWRRTSLEACFTRKKLMLATIAVWLAALAVGFVLYGILYWSALMS